MANNKADHWSSEKYQNAAGFVPQLTTKVLEYLSPQPGEKILDIGCGDGQLTTTIASRVTDTGHVLGLDASPSFIATAQKSNTLSQLKYELQDCTELDQHELTNAHWDKVFSNAAMHWILRAPETRAKYFSAVHRALKPGGRFIFEMGGKGNCAELHTAFTAALTTVGGLLIDAAREASPWFFPSVDWMREALEDAGFNVLVCESEYRPTKSTESRQDGSGGLDGWVRLMGASFLEAVDESKREEVVKRVCEWVEGAVAREEDGISGRYVRLGLQPSALAAQADLISRQPRLLRACHNASPNIPQTTSYDHQYPSVTYRLAPSISMMGRAYTQLQRDAVKALLEAGADETSIERDTSVSDRTIRRWKLELEKTGRIGKPPESRTGRHRVLNPEVEQALC
ncbi:hypothetical protein LTR95_010549, partial [Oleoguttula sp. CCFEE 5521]